MKPNPNQQKPNRVGILAKILARCTRSSSVRPNPDQQKSNIETALDNCLARLQSGETLESCLAAYPDMAESLHPLLALTGRIQSLSHPQARPESMEAGRKKVLAALPAHKTTPAPWVELARRIRRLPATIAGTWLGKGTPGLKLALRATFAFILLIAVLQIGLVASADSLPGDTLYPVKRSAEQVRMFFTLDTQAQQQLQQQYAEERYKELRAVLQLGRQVIVEIEGTLQAIEQDLWVVAGFSIKLDRETIVEGSPQVGRRIRGQVQVRPDGTLLALQLQVFDPPEPDPLPTSTPAPSATPNQTTQLLPPASPAPITATSRVTQPVAPTPASPPSATPLPSSPPQQGPTPSSQPTIAPGRPSPTPTHTTPTPIPTEAAASPTPTATAATPGRPTSTGTPSSPTPTYATPTPSATAATASPTPTPTTTGTPSSPTPTMSRTPSPTSPSLSPTPTPTPTGTPSSPTPTTSRTPTPTPRSLTPTPTVTATASPPSPTPTTSWTPTPTPRSLTPTPTPTTPQPTPTHVPGPIVQIFGFVQAVNATSITVEDERGGIIDITITPDTIIVGNPAVGSFVYIEAEQTPADGLVALYIEVLDGPPGDIISISGLVLAINSTMITVDDQQGGIYDIAITPGTIIVGGPAIGDLVYVEAEEDPGGSLVALYIEVLNGPPGNTIPISGLVRFINSTRITVDNQQGGIYDVAITPGTIIVGGPTVGDLVYVEAEEDPGGSLVALYIEVLSGPPGNTIPISGIVLSINSTMIVVDDQQGGIYDVAITFETVIVGEPAIGDLVYVEAEVARDGSMTALYIEMIDRSPPPSEDS